MNRKTAKARAKLLVFKPDGTQETVECRGNAPSLDELQLAVGGLIQSVRAKLNGRVVRPLCWVNEEGVLHDLPYNETATLMVRDFGYGRILGNLVIELRPHVKMQR